MTQRVQIPKFGNWEGESTVPYTVYFDKAVGSHGKGKVITQSGHNLENLCNGSSFVEADSNDGMEKLTEMEQPNWEVPKFGDWDGIGEDPQYTVYFEKVGKKGSRGHGLYENYAHNNKSAEKAYSPARKVTVEGSSPQHPKVKKDSVAVYGKSKQESPNRLQGNSAASSEGRKKMPTRQNPDSKHVSTAGVLPRNSSTETRIRSPRNFGNLDESRMRNNPRQNELVAPDAVVRNSGSWDEFDPSNTRKHRSNKLESRSVTDSSSSYNKVPTPMKKHNANTCCFPWSRK